MNWQDCEPFVSALVALDLSHADTETIEVFWRIWQAASGYGAQEVWESMRAGAVVASQKAVLGVPADVLEKARRLQALALDESAAPQERENAWSAFSKIWQEYKNQLPPDFGL